MLADALRPHGDQVRGVDVRGALHLKTACSALGGGRFLVDPARVDPAALDARVVVEVDAAEPGGANAFVVASPGGGAAVVHDAAHPRTARRLAALGLRVVAVDDTDLAKAEGGVTCCSLRLA